MNLELVGHSLTSYTAEFTVGLQLSDGYFVRIESPFTMIFPTRSITLSPEEDSAESFKPIGELIGQSITESIADSTGTLSITFSNSVRFVVEPDTDYEAWTIGGPGGMLIVCTPGGELAVWSPDQQETGGESN